LLIFPFSYFESRGHFFEKIEIEWAGIRPIICGLPLVIVMVSPSLTPPRRGLSE